MQGREKEVVIVTLVRSNDKGTRIVKQTSRYERGVNRSQENNGCSVYEQIRCQNSCISHRGFRHETRARLYTFTLTLHLLYINTKLPL